MINVSRLLSNDSSFPPGDSLRYSRAGGRRCPVIVWHMTGLCNLSCHHCYAGGVSSTPENRMAEEDGMDFLRRLAKLSVPAILLSGGEPMLCPGFFRLVTAAHELGLNVTVSTNGTLVDKAAAEFLGVYAHYAGISVDGPRDVHDGFRGASGTFDAAMRAIGLLASAGCRVGLRVTLASPILKYLGEIFRIAEELPISRICFYHFMPSGRGADDSSLAPGNSDEDLAIHRIIEWADSKPFEVLTVGDSSDNVRIYEFLESKSDGRLGGAAELMKISSAKPAGGGILSVRWDGEVFRNQFMWSERLGRWGEIEKIASSEASMSRLAAECEDCAWARKICGGRLDGFGKSCGRRKAAE